jgi:hypothetical protein
VYSVGTKIFWPFPFLQKLTREQKAIRLAFGIKPCAGITVSIADVADASTSLKHAGFNAQFTQAV